MTIGFIFWFIMLCWLIFGIANHFNWGNVSTYGPLGNVVLLFVLFFLLGWAEFGFMIRR